MTYHQMIEQADVEKLAGFADFMGYLAVSPARFRHARRMIMRQNQRGGVELQRLPDDLAWGHFHTVNRPREHFLCPQHPVLIIQKERHKDLALLMG